MSENKQLEPPGDASGEKTNSAVKRNADGVFNDPSSPAKIEKMDESGSLPVDDADVGTGESSQGISIDLDKLGVEDGIQPIANWSSGLKNVSVEVHFVAVKYDSDLRKDAKGGKDAFTILVEDESDKTHICSFGDEAKLLKKELSGREGSVVKFFNLHSRIPKPDFERFLPGKARFELQFQKTSELKFIPSAEETEPIQKMSDFLTAIGNVETNFRMVAIAKFKNFSNSGKSSPLYRGWASDGIYIIELEMPFEPPFTAGDEFNVSRATGRKNEGKIYLFIAKPEDVTKVADEEKTMKRQLQGLKYLEY